MTRIGKERSMQRTWCKEDERWDEGVKHDRNRKDCALQFYSLFRYNYKGPCHVYHEETQQEKEEAEVVLKEENADTQARYNKLQHHARLALSQLSESDVNKRYRTRKRALKKVAPWINSLKKRGIKCILLQDGASAHKSRIARDYLTIQHVERLWWPGHSPEVNATEHAWPWIRRHVTKDFTPSCTEKECEDQWVKEWDAMPYRGHQSMGGCYSRAGTEDTQASRQEQLSRIVTTPENELNYLFVLLIRCFGEDLYGGCERAALC
ncbi:hypothetical protein EK21DRAFT_88226 [Setomelanomma holmii]|uniref:Tc1-like transposase DDE domain-containing protein n=1 Tax=Setomelanomma holmii TaxID=210430 RepID=A0A9P4HC14_9PLEO|nr:hypothetical protein EK21DRAFT_88226 [Setomelanomma holmii]